MCNDMKESNFIECFLWTQQKETIQLQLENKGIRTFNSDIFNLFLPFHSLLVKPVKQPTSASSFTVRQVCSENDGTMECIFFYTTE